jgi:hypothetical protein
MAAPTSGAIKRSPSRTVWNIPFASPSRSRGSSTVMNAERAPASVEWLRTAAPGVVLELPWDTPGDSALYVYWSTRHWQRMVNGFGSFDPPGSIGSGLLGNRWPSAYSAAQFRKAGIRYVVVHMDRVRAPHKARILAAELPEGVRLEADFVADRVYVIDPLPAGGDQ